MSHVLTRCTTRDVAVIMPFLIVFSQFIAVEIITVKDCPDHSSRTFSIEDLKNGTLANVVLTPPTATLNTTNSSVIIEGKLIEGPTNNLFAITIDGQYSKTMVKYEFRGVHHVEYCSFWVFVSTGKFPFLNFCWHFYSIHVPPRIECFIPFLFIRK